jgi:DNA repair protein RadC
MRKMSNFRRATQLHNIGRDFGNTELQLALGCGVEDAELLGLVLSRHYSGKHARRLAKSLIRKSGSLKSVFLAGYNTIKHRVRIRDHAVLDILHTGQLLFALSKSEISNRPLLENQEAVIDFCREQIGGLGREEFHAIFLNKRHELLRHVCLQRGTVDHVTVYPRELMNEAIQHGASGIILVHNHPYGNAAPSEADVELTMQLAKVGEILGVKILDHLIVGGCGVYSFKRDGRILNQKHQGYRLPLIPTH